MLRGCRSGFSPTLLYCCLLALTSSVQAEDGLLGRHKIDLRLKSLPATEVLNLLSVRSKAVGQLPESVADRGRPWLIEGADKLDGIVVVVNFSATPVQQVVAEILGCIGFGYTEHGDRIVIEQQAHTLPPDQCRCGSTLRRELSGIHIRPI
jgi:hypothetical protein